MEKSISPAFAIKFSLGCCSVSIVTTVWHISQWSFAVPGRRYWFNPLIKSECQSKQWPANFEPGRMNGKMEKINRKGDLSSLGWQTRYSIIPFAPLTQYFVEMQCCCCSWMAERLREVPQIRHLRKIKPNPNKWSHLPACGYMTMTKRRTRKWNEIIFATSIPHFVPKIPKFVESAMGI